MRRYINRIAGAIAVLLGVSSGAATAAPLVTVSIGTPRIVMPAPHYEVVRVQPVAPPGWTWVHDSWRRDVTGRPIFVAGHWQPAMRTIVVPRPAARTVVVHRY